MASRTLSYDPKKRTAAAAIDRQSAAKNIASGHLVWLDITGLTDSDLAYLTDTFELTPLMVRELTAERALPKLVTDASVSFLNWYSLGKAGAGAPIRFTCLFGPGFLVTVHSDSAEALEQVWQDAQTQPDIMGQGLGVLLYNVMDAAVDDYFLAVDALSDQVDRIEDVMFDRPKPSDVKDIFKMKRQMLELRKVTAPEREVVNSLLRRSLPYLEKDSRAYFEDLYDHMVRVIDLIDTLRDVTSGAMQIYQATISNNLNAIMKQLTIIATIMMPLTLISGIFGMNLGFPGKEGALGFWIVMVVMLGIGVAMLIWFRKREWI